MKHSLGIGDFWDAQFEIVQFPADSARKRTVRTFEMNERDLLDIDELNTKIQETYEIWIEILSDREKKRRAG
jgi:hypothetical protein